MIGLNLGLTNACAAGHSLIALAIGRLRTYGTNAHVYLPGVGVLNGLQAANYLDSAGTTPGTVDQPVGLVLDAAGVLGVELVTNGDFSAGSTGWSTSAGCVITTGVLTVNSAPAAPCAYQGILTAGKVYAITYTIATISSGGFYSFVGNSSSGPTHATPGTYTEYTTCIGNSNGGIGCTVNTIGTVTNVSYKEITGIHASQSTTPAKPVLRRGIVCLNNYSKDRTNAWYGSGYTNNSATQVQITTGGYQVAQFPCSVGSVITTAAVLSGVPGTQVSLFVGDNAGAYGGTTLLITLTATPTLYVWTRTMLEAAGLCGLMVVSGGTVVVDVAAQGAFNGTYTASQIQALGGIPLTTTAPASTALGPYWWEFKGAQSLGFSGPLFQMADDFFVCVAASCNNKAVYPVIARPSKGVTSRVGWMYFDAGGIVSAAYVTDANVPAYVVGPSFVDGQIAVISHRKQSGLCRTDLNSLAGVEVAAPTGVYTVTNGDIGESLSGMLGPAVAVKGSVTPADQLTIKHLVAFMSGVTI